MNYDWNRKRKERKKEVWIGRNSLKGEIKLNGGYSKRSNFKNCKSKHYL